MLKKVLLVDDVKSIVEREKTLLDRDIFQVFVATSGPEAIDIHKREKVDIIVMDLNMPQMSGDVACKIIREDQDLKKVSIILATMVNSQEELDRCTSSGANACIKKPVDRDELVGKMSSLLGIPSRQAIRILVRVKVEGKVGNDFFIANTVDVSVSGMLFECDKSLHIGDMLEASFFLPGSSGYNRVVARGEIMREAPGSGENRKFGVKFVEFKEGSSEMVAEFIQKKTTKN